MRSFLRTSAASSIAIKFFETDVLRCNSVCFQHGLHRSNHGGWSGTIVGAIVIAERSQPVAWLARDLGANRQNVQRIVNDLKRDGLVAFEPNPHHKRAQLVVLTPKGRQVFAAAMQLYDPGANALSEGLAIDDIRIAHRIMMTLRSRLERAARDENHS